MENDASKQAQDKLKSTTENGEVNKENLAFDEHKQSYELDVTGENKEYDHPMGYETVAQGAKDDDSTYDNSNPYIGDEYADKAEIADDELESLGMHVDSGQSVKVGKKDEALAHTPEDDRDDLDEEGYPKNDQKTKE
ncbi:hypothetical protein [Pedobacter sp. UYEF25]